MKNKIKQTETTAVAPEAPRDEYAYFRMVAEKYLPRPDLDGEEYRRRWDDNEHPATEPKLPPNEEAEYFRKIRQFRDRRKEAGLKIDPETAETCMIMGESLDPYGINPLLPRGRYGVPCEKLFRTVPRKRHMGVGGGSATGYYRCFVQNAGGGRS